MSPTRRSRIRQCAVTLVLLLASAGVAHGQKKKVELLEFSLEELLNTEVTSVSRKAQSLVGAPAAVSVISQDDIRRSGLSSVPELLRLVPRLQVARIDGSKWAISARGFNQRTGARLATAGARDGSDSAWITP